MKRRNNSNTIVAEPKQTSEQLQKAISRIHKSPEYSYNFRIPMELYEEIQEHLDHSGQSFKKFLIFSIKDYLSNQK